MPPSSPTEALRQKCVLIPPAVGDHINVDSLRHHGVGYKVNSEHAVQFRKWATGIVEEYSIKAYASSNT